MRLFETYANASIHCIGRWNGMPDSAKRKGIESKGADKSKPDSISSARHGCSEGTRTERYSTQSNVRTSLDDQNTSLQVPSSQRPPTHPRLEPLPELSPFPSDLDLGKYDAPHAEKLDKSSSSPGSTAEESPTTPPAEMNDISPAVLGVDHPEPCKHPKAINFSRPFLRSPEV